MNDSVASRWIYLKLYPGTQMERADRFIPEVCRRMTANEHLERWFFLRYVDEAGFHVRVRGLPRLGHETAARETMHEDCAEVLDHLYEYLPSTYQPMVSPPAHLMPDDTPPADPRLRLIYDNYMPEWDKFGGEKGVAIAEALFHASSLLAGRILADEARGLYHRKTLAPALMHAANEAFPTAEHSDYWIQYALYWLGGDSPAARDWLQRFAAKRNELAAAGRSVLPSRDELPSAAIEVLDRWRAELATAAAAYAAGEATVRGADVLSLNFAHLMMNRLGIAALEESYLAALLGTPEHSSVAA